MPVLPFLEDSLENVTAVVEAAHETGANFIYPAFGMTLRENQRIWYYDKLKELWPEEDYADKYRKTYGNRYQCTSRNAQKLWAVFQEKCEAYHILYKMRDIIHAYKKNYGDGQMNLFDFL